MNNDNTFMLMKNGRQAEQSENLNCLIKKYYYYLQSTSELRADKVSPSVSQSCLSPFSQADHTRQSRRVDRANR